jgi:hypothetical protein
MANSLGGCLLDLGCALAVLGLSAFVACACWTKHCVAVDSLRGCYHCVSVASVTLACIVCLSTAITLSARPLYAVPKPVYVCSAVLSVL